MDLSFVDYALRNSCKSQATIQIWNKVLELRTHNTEVEEHFNLLAEQHKRWRVSSLVDIATNELHDITLEQGNTAIHELDAILFPFPSRIETYKEWMRINGWWAGKTLLEACMTKCASDIAFSAKFSTVIMNSSVSLIRPLLREVSESWSEDMISQSHHEFESALQRHS